MGMSRSRLTQPVGVVEQHFGAGVIPTIAQSFVPGRGWQNAPGRKRLSRAWVTTLKREGVSAVALAHDGRLADFRVEELLASDRRHGRRGVR